MGKMAGWSFSRLGLATAFLAAMLTAMAVPQMSAAGTNGPQTASQALGMPLIAAHQGVSPSGDLDVPLTVKESAEVGATACPVSAVVPLPRGRFATAAGLGIAGTPSQVEVLERWPDDSSLRNVLVHFQATVSARGDAIYHFTDGGRTDPAEPVVVAETPGAITVTTGPLRFVVSTTVFSILDRAWLDRNGNRIYESGEQIIASQPQNGGVFVPRVGCRRGAVRYRGVPT